MGRGKDTAAGKHAAVYLRVSGKGQDTASQEPELKRWADGQAGPVVTYHDTFTGTTMDRPGFARRRRGRQGLPRRRLAPLSYLNHYMSVTAFLV